MKKKVSIWSLTMLMVMFVGFSSCSSGSGGGSGNTSNSTSEDGYSYLSGKTFVGGNSDGYYFKLDFNTDKTCDVRFGTPMEAGWRIVGSNLPYTINTEGGKLRANISDAPYKSYSFYINSLTLISTEGKFRMQEGNINPWKADY